MIRRFPRLLSATALVALLAFVTPAEAQYYNNNNVVMQRMDKLESDIMLLQRQLARGEVTPGAPIDGAGAAQLQVRLSDLEEQLRRLQGMIEENNFQNRQLAERLDKLSMDVDYRLSAIERASGTSPAGVPMNTMGGAIPQPPAATTPTAPSTPETTAPTPVVPQGSLQVPDPNAPKPDDSGNATFSNPRDHYNYAFGLLNKTQYDAAARSFEKFLATYPKDPLAGNAFYWLGETYYVRREYIKAADYFRQGFEVAPTGPKAADNLLKLSMTLSAIGRNKEACVVLNQLLVKFGASSTTLKQKTEQEINRLGCQ